VPLVVPAEAESPMGDRPRQSRLIGIDLGRDVHHARPPRRLIGNLEIRPVGRLMAP
jgi:hypothetical protein